jgi:hypothetical protein
MLSESDWTIAAWPVIGYEAEVEYGRLFSHRPVPVDAYDLNDDLIAPDQLPCSSH